MKLESKFNQMLKNVIKAKRLLNKEKIKKIRKE